jgi:Zn-dependent protease with chaperone function
MDFFARQDLARKRTKLLVFYFAVAVVLISLMVYAAVMVGVNFAKQPRAHRHAEYQPAPPIILWHAQAFVGAGLGTLLVILIGSAWKTSQLSGGGGSVATMMGGRLVNPDSAEPNERKLLNIVEEMSIASGVPMPEVYVLDHEEGINAFAAGHSTNDAAIGVTRGCIRLLSRDELQGVIGHEFSHVLNGDMRLNLRLIGIIFGILCLATIGRILLRVRSSGSSKGKNPLPLLGLALILIGGVGVIFGRLIQAAVSRQREFLADASAVQFTRNPSGLSGALQKIGRHSFGSKLESEHAPDLCHMFFGNGLRSPLFGLMATHPPIPDRIRAIEPSWDGTFPALKPEQFETVKRAAMGCLEHRPKGWVSELGGNLKEGQASPRPAGIPFLDPIQTSQLRAGGSPVEIQPQSVLPSIGNVSPLQLQYAEAMRDALPDRLKAAARQPLDATALTYALLLDADAERRAGPLAEIARRISPAVAEKTAALFPEVSAVARSARLPLVNLALGALRNLTAEEFEVFSGTLAWLVESDGEIALFEFVLQKIVLHHLGPKFGGKRPAAVQYYTLKPLVPDCAVLLSALAHVGSGDAADVQRAFAAGAPFLRAPAGLGLALVSREQCGVDTVDAALNRLTLAVPIIKKNLLEAAARVVGADGLIHEAEAELLRAVAETLDCPLPPLGVDAGL